MTRFALRGILGRKLRTALTAIAIVLGVAMVCGTYVLTDSITAAFDAIFASTYRNTDAVVTGKRAFSGSQNGSSASPSFDESLLPKVTALPDVAAALGGVQGDAHLIGKNGKSIVFGGAPNIGFSVDPTQPRFNSLTLVKGSWPGPGQLVVDESTAGKKDLQVGQTIGVQSRGPVQKFDISGIAKYGAVSSIGGATLAGFDLRTAQQLFGKTGQLDQIRIAAKSGVSPQQLVAEVAKILPRDTQVKTGTAQATSDANDTTDFLSFLQKILLAFGLIALFVGAFVIANSLSITIAQRTREFATLRTIGASRGQVMVSVIVEAFAVGILASLVGLFFGLGLAKGLFKLFDAAGLTLPNNGLTTETRTVVVSLALGIGITVLASVYPALRATMVPPIAAVREGATLPSEPLDAIRGIWPAVIATAVGVVGLAASISLKPATTLVTIVLAVVFLVITLFGCALFPSRTVGALVSFGLGFASLLYGLFGSGLGATRVLLFIGVGVLLVFFGFARVATPLIPGLSSFMSPVARWSVFGLNVLVWPFWTFPYWCLRYGIWGPGRASKRVIAFVPFVLLGPVLLVVGIASTPSSIGLAVVGGLYTAMVLVVLVMAVRKRLTSWAPEWPADFPSVVPDRSTTRVGRENARRNPQRTASTAAALMIGLALVTLVATLASGIIKPFKDAVDQLFVADYAITAQNNFDPIPPSAARAAAKVPGVVAIASVRGGDGEILRNGQTTLIQVTGAEPQTSRVIDMKWQDGSPTTIDHLGSNGAVISKAYAKDHDLVVGSPIVVLTPSGSVLALKVKGIMAPPTGGSPFGTVTISSSAFDAHYQQPLNLFTFVKMRGGVTDANTKALDDALKGFPNAKAQTRQQFKDNQIAGFTTVLNIIYVLLALSVVVSFFGIVNTLVLTVYERTRELGMLRAIGMTRRQVRRMIRHESVMTALIGAALGIVLGLVLGGVLAFRVKEIVFAVPWIQLVVFTIAAIVVGIIAAILPARRAARLDPLQAIAYE
ncbi:MAG TPA: FtsX-like permease family protein [Gaiellaceae bacterium]|nr:FtsX-like permease family protein [Gaiellaceae bacterium]